MLRHKQIVQHYETAHSDKKGKKSVLVNIMSCLLKNFL